MELSVCVICKKAAIEYAAVPCGCASLCAGCAKRVATGGRCKVCKELFGEVKKIK